MLFPALIIACFIGLIILIAALFNLARRLKEEATFQEAVAKNKVEIIYRLETEVEWLREELRRRAVPADLNAVRSALEKVQYAASTLEAVSGPVDPNAPKGQGRGGKAD